MKYIESENLESTITKIVEELGLANTHLYTILDRINELPTLEEQDIPGYFVLDGSKLNIYMKGYNEARKDFERPNAEWTKVVDSTEMYDNAGFKTWGTIYQCPKCGIFHNVVEDRHRYSFCPECGADMRSIQ